jgi:hypothetical protein
MSIPFLTAPCGCIMDTPSKLFLLLNPTEKHRKLHEEFDAGIIHDWKCGLKFIEVPQLVLNKEVIING